MLEGRSLSAKRPEHFFREEGPMPPTADLRFVRPEEFKGWSHAEWMQTIRDRVRAKEKEAARGRARKGLRVLGVRSILVQRWSSRPTLNEPRRRLSPRVVAKNKWRRVEALLENKHFLRAYRKARDKMIAGVKDVFFPPGTYWLKRFVEVACADAACVDAFMV
jgi:hypothetical protein